MLGRGGGVLATQLEPRVSAAQALHRHSLAHVDESARVRAGFFLTRIFHPNISKTGEICVNTLKKDWKPELGIGHVLQVVRCLLINPFPESALNEEAGKLFMEDYDEYSKKVRVHH